MCTPSTAFSTSHPAPSVLENNKERETENEETIKNKITVSKTSVQAICLGIRSSCCESPVINSERKGSSRQRKNRLECMKIFSRKP